jgi:23S rRNA pseudouridine1911/1915/1917 synthase
LNYNFQIRSKASNIRLDIFLAHEYPEITRSKIQFLIKNKSILLNGEVTKPSYSVCIDDEIICQYSEVPRNEILPDKIDLNILFEDDNIIVINKPSNLVVHPGNGNWTGTLANALVYHFEKLSATGTIRPGIVHRLDKETSGIIVVAKTDFDHQHISSQFSNRTVNKVYKALVWGKTPNEGIIDGMIGRNPSHRQSFKVVLSGGRIAETRYKLEEYYHPISLLTVTPFTGRTHQIRVHMKDIGHPIFGDKLYGGGTKKIKSFHEKYSKKIKALFKILPRTALHAYSLEITHPRTGKQIKWTAPVADDIQNVIETLTHE